MFVLQERGAAEEAPIAISQEAPWSAAAELEAGARAWPLPEGQSLLGPFFNPLASVLSVGGNQSCSFLTNGIIYFSDAIFLAVFDFAFLLACLEEEAGRDMEVILSAASIVKSFKLEQESVNCDSSSKTGQENSFCHQGACKSPICVQSQIEGLPNTCFPLLNKRHGLNISI